MPDNLSDAEREMLERGDKATIGPWSSRTPPPCTYSADGGKTYKTKVIPPHVVHVFMDDEGCRHTQFICGEVNGAGLPNVENADFIAHARTDIPTLLETISALRTEQDELKRKLLQEGSLLDEAESRVGLLQSQLKSVESQLAEALKWRSIYDFPEVAGTYFGLTKDGSPCIATFSPDKRTKNAEGQCEVGHWHPCFELIGWLPAPPKEQK